MGTGGIVKKTGRRRGGRIVASKPNDSNRCSACNLRPMCKEKNKDSCRYRN